MKIENKENDKNLIIGRNAVKEALKSNRPIESVIISASIEDKKAIKSIIEKAKENKIPVKRVDSKKLDVMCKNAVHQGIIAVAAVHEYSSLEYILNSAKEKNEEPFIIIADEIEDPYNLGAIIRTAECAGAHGVVVKQRHAAGLTFTVGRSSAGAIEYLPVSRVTNISKTIDELKNLGFWIYGTDMNGTNWCETDLKGKIAVVIGNEGKGISRLVKEKCDLMLTLPMKGHIDSLNASVAAGIVMYEVLRQRSGIKMK